MPSEANVELRAELIRAIAAVRQQTTVQSTADHHIGCERINEEALRELQAELAKAEDALAGLS